MHGRACLSYQKGRKGGFAPKNTTGAASGELWTTSRTQAERIRQADYPVGGGVPPGMFLRITMV